MFWLDALQGLTLIFQVLLCYFFNYIDRYSYTQFDLKKKNYILFKTDTGFIKFQSTPLFKDLK